MRWRLAFLLLLAGCGVHEQPFTYNDQKEMAGRAGLFTVPGGAIMYRDAGTPLLGK